MLAFIVGASSGIVGAGGAFILVPIMLVILKLPTHMTIATSLAITFISSISITAGKSNTRTSSGTAVYNDCYCKFNRFTTWGKCREEIKSKSIAVDISDFDCFNIY